MFLLALCIVLHYTCFPRMRKVWTYKRKARPGWYVMWYDDAGRQRAKRCPDKRSADLYAARLEHTMNQDLYCEPLKLAWDQLCDEYIAEKRDVQRRADGSIASIRTILGLFGKIAGSPHSLAVDDRLLRLYVSRRNAAGASPATVNRDLRTLHAFVTWAVETDRMGPTARQIRWSSLRQREPARVVRSLSVSELAKLLVTAERLYGADWRIRLLLALGTGLRLRDVENLTIEAISFDQGGITTHSKKTGKGMGLRPLHPTIMRELRHYIEGRESGRILVDVWHHSKWERIRTAAKLPHVTHKMLRKTFASFLAQAGYSTAVVQDLLEHSDPRLTKEIYTDVSPVYRAAAESLPIDAILAASSPRSDGTASAPNRLPDSAEADRPCNSPDRSPRAATGRASAPKHQSPVPPEQA